MMKKLFIPGAPSWRPMAIAARMWRRRRRRRLRDRRDAGTSGKTVAVERRRRRGPGPRGFERSGPVRIRPGGHRQGDVHRCLHVVLEAADGQGRDA